MTDAEEHLLSHLLKRVRRFGSVIASRVAQNLRFQGQYQDWESGLNCNTFRHYNPAMGRMTTQDRIGLMSGDNLYRHAPTTKRSALAQI
ncbi:RHS repeat-associated core domain-containing protein [Pseudomonas protegens]|uniref:RHS repeat-associated core domain-containing protein n=1 Tax=Pseudomonas protegens TaxID=380021 RepID=UPI002936E3DC|nr:RHS repeat-associated core domain-containing protein [Pseudomonas protegens]WOE77269.1 RHS repeat-associated core domain-containing protein [Pseudomonas protegens]